jgi:hypothetical protein
MTSVTQTREGQFVEVGWGFHDVLVGSRVFLPLRWTMLEKVLRVGAMRRWFYLTYNCQMREQGLCQAPSCLVAAVDGGASRGM